ncbi:MAG: V-type ATPase subunit [Nitrospirae bacterium]|nr:V-type ATPase subunit [Nitrospirota bacterium]
MADYAYINTRIRSMEADLLTERQLRELMSCLELSNAISYLKKGAYGVYLPEAASGYLSYIIDEAIRCALSDSIKKLATITKGDDDNLIEILLGRWDMFNIKTLIRGKLNNIPSFEVLQATIPAGILNEGLLEEIYKQPSVNQIINMLVTIGFSYASPLLKINYIHEIDLFKGELELEKSFFSFFLRKLSASEKRDINSKIVHNFMQLLIDRYNLIAAVKMSEEGFDADDKSNYFIEGGRIIPPDVYKKMISSRDITECISMIESNEWKNRWHRFSSKIHVTSPALLVERWMDYEILMHAIKLPREDPLNIGLAIGFIWKKINEVINLRTILRGIQFNIPQDEIEGLLIILRRP